MRDRRTEVLDRALIQSWTDPDASPIAVRRLAAHWSQRDLADRADIGVMSVVRAERGENVSATTMQKIAAALGCPREEIDPSYRSSLAPWDRTA